MAQTLPHVLIYVFPPTVTFTSNAHIARSDATVPGWLRGANPGGWHPIEWEELLDGDLGPWAMVVEGEQVLSIAHTPRPTTDAEAECGVWTLPEARGQGYAAAAAAAWAEILRPSGRRLIYSTSEDNRSSQRVAERLKLRLVDRIQVPKAEHESKVHPLSSVRGGD